MDPLLAAANLGKIAKAMQLLDKGVDPNVRDEHGTTALHFAAGRGHLEIVRLLLERGADPNAVNSVGYTPLMSAARNSRRDAAAALLATGKVDPNQEDSAGFTALILAANYADPATVQLLLDHGGNAAFRSSRGWTVLSCAVLNPEPGVGDIIGLLLDAGADIDARDADGTTALEEAERRGRIAAATALRKHRTVR
jgi:ankyrin repeat protein